MIDATPVLHSKGEGQTVFNLTERLAPRGDSSAEDMSESSQPLSDTCSYNTESDISVIKKPVSVRQDLTDRSERQFPCTLACGEDLYDVPHQNVNGEHSSNTTNSLQLPDLRGTRKKFKSRKHDKRKLRFNPFEENSD